MTRPDRLRILTAGLAVFVVALVARAAWVQLWQGSRWAERGRNQHFAGADLPAPRGTILDATGDVIAESREMVRLNVAPREVALKNGIPRLRRALLTLGFEPDDIARATDTSRRWVELRLAIRPGLDTVAAAIAGVHTERVMERAYSGSEGLRRVVGRVNSDGPVDGIERSLDSLLAGVKGSAAVPRDARGNLLAPVDPGRTAVLHGQTVMLTLNRGVQDIAERALSDALRNTGATGGDIVVMDPHDGALLALAARRPAVSTAVTAFTEPYEPGSTLKPFVAARLLALHKARADEVIGTFNGQYKLEGRTITDVHRAPQLTLRDVIKFSSNIGIVRFGERLSAMEEYDLLHEAGFGTATGVPYPVESRGRLPLPARWSRQSRASILMGYELAVTPVQLVAAYAAFANGGELLRPALVREIRDAEGRVRFRHERRVVRRLMTPGLADSVRGMLRDVVEGGTAESAALAAFEVAGKSGTARRVEHGKYVAGAYTASFIGLFPADKPQLVILVKLDNPRDGYYGGKVAAPVFRQVALGAIAARDGSLDFSQLAGSQNREALVDSTAAARAATEAMAASRAASTPAMVAREAAETVAVQRASSADTGLMPFVVRLDAPRVVVARLGGTRKVPDVHGLTLRRAVLLLHDAGFRVVLGDGAGGTTVPVAGSMAPPGSVVHLGAW